MEIRGRLWAQVAADGTIPGNSVSSDMGRTAFGVGDGGIRVAHWL